jgi:formamidopyrimidine-DNA glycosylase
MPELPEVETVRRVMRRALQGKRIAEVEVVPDAIVQKGVAPQIFEQALLGRTVQEVGRKGKYWWLELDESPWMFGHLGMSGWIRELGKPTVRLREHGKKPLDGEDGRPRFLKLMLTAEDGCRIAFTDGRRLARMWLSESAAADPKIQELGPDVLENPRSAKELHAILSRRQAPIKALLLNQELFAGVGNWIADEALYQARIAPARLGASLSAAEVNRLREKLIEICQIAVDAGADSDLYPETWIFKHRWGGGRGVELFEGKPIVREQIGGRTTAWVPKVQK